MDWKEKFREKFGYLGSGEYDALESFIESLLEEEKGKLMTELQTGDTLAYYEHGVSVGYKMAKEEYKEALQWCGGSEDFQFGGKAREGWEKICIPLLKS